MLSMMLMILGCSAHATKEVVEQANQAALSTLNVDDKIIGDNGAQYFDKILSGGGLYVLLVSLNSELPEIAQTLEYIALFQEAHTTNNLLSDILVELKKNNQLLSQRRQDTRGGGMNE